MADNRHTDQLRQLKMLFGFEFVSLAVRLDGGHPLLTWINATGNLNTRYRRIVLEPGKGIAGEIYRSGKSIVIQDADQYTSFLSSVIGNNTAKPFYFDSYYQAYYISDYFSLIEPSGDYPPYISHAEVGLVLFADEEQRIIFVALGMYDGGGANVEELNYFFDRFDIYPQSYAKRAKP